MRSVSILHHAVDGLQLRAPPQRILELGAGDGSLLLRFARSLPVRWPAVQATLLDRLDLLDGDTRAEFAALGWEVKVLRSDALVWATRTSDCMPYDLCLTTLFLHHLQTPALRSVLEAVAARSMAFIACEPRRNTFSLCGSHLLGFLGANDVTRRDGVTSVVAGFANHELTSLWPAADASWQLTEYLAWPFTHCFVAHRARAHES
jgi:hypothetical protein